MTRPSEIASAWLTAAATFIVAILLGPAAADATTLTVTFDDFALYSGGPSADAPDTYTENGATFKDWVSFLAGPISRS